MYLPLKSTGVISESMVTPHGAKNPTDVFFFKNRIL